MELLGGLTPPPQPEIAARTAVPVDARPRELLVESLLTLAFLVVAMPLALHAT